LFGRPDFQRACPQLPEEALWLLGAAGARKYDSLPAAPPRARARRLEASGLFCIASLEPFPHTLVVDAGPQGFGNAGHGHADALSVQLVAQGHAALIDPGTCCYPVEIAERNAFRGTAAHNTLEVDGLDQSEPGGSFAWRTQPQVSAERWVEGRGGALLVASHDGYARLAEPVTHRRWVASLGSGLYLIRDVATGEGAHTLRLHWHLGPDFRDLGATGTSEVEDTDRPPLDGYCLRCEGPGGIAMDLITAQGDARNASHRGVACSVGEGVWSAAYGHKAAAAVVRCEKQTPLPAEFATAIAVTSAGVADTSSLEALEEAPGELSVYRYRGGERCVLVFFCDSEKSWGWREWSSDAVFLAVETDSNGRECRRIFLAAGSFLETAKGRILDCNRQVAFWEWLPSEDGGQAICSDPEAVEREITQELEFSLLSSGELP
jgi:hypothetical protein